MKLLLIRCLQEILFKFPRILASHSQSSTEDLMNQRLFPATLTALVS